METLFIVLLIGGILALAGSIIWVLFIKHTAPKTHNSVASALTDMGSNPYESMSELDALLGELDRVLRSASMARAFGGHAGDPRLPPQRQLEIQSIVTQTRNRMRRLDNLSRRRYETRMADLSGMAASAGIDWMPGSY